MFWGLLSQVQSAHLIFGFQTVIAVLSVLPSFYFCFCLFNLFIVVLVGFQEEVKLDACV